MLFRVIWLALKYPLPYPFNYTNTKWRLSYFRLEPLFGTSILLRNISTIYAEYISFEKFALDSVSVPTIEGTVTDGPRLSSIFLYLPIPSYTFHHINENERSQAMIRLHGRFCYQYVGANVQINNCAYSYLFLWLCIWPVWGLSCGLPLTMDSGRALDPRYRHRTFISQVFGTLCLLGQ